MLPYIPVISQTECGTRCDPKLIVTPAPRNPLYGLTRQYLNVLHQPPTIPTIPLPVLFPSAIIRYYEAHGEYGLLGSPPACLGFVEYMALSEIV